MKIKMSILLFSLVFYLYCFASDHYTNGIILGTVSSVVANTSMIIMNKNGFDSHTEITPYGVVAITDKKNQSQSDNSYKVPKEDPQDQKILFMND
jgi:hypothetical protein